MYSNLFLNKSYVASVYSNCVINQETMETKDIIYFYNEVFLKQMKSYILLYRDELRLIH